MYFVGVVSHFLVLCRICNQCISTTGGGYANRYLSVTITAYVCFVGVVSRFFNPRSNYNAKVACSRGPENVIKRPTEAVGPAVTLDVFLHAVRFR